MKLQTEKINITKIRKLFDGFSMIEEVSFCQRDHSGNWSQTVDREIFSKGDAVAIIPYHPGSDKVCMVKQIRPAAVLNDCSAEQWEIPAGLVSKGEGLEVAAKRELEEETNIVDVNLQFICDFFPSPGNSKDRVFLFAAILNNPLLTDGLAGVETEGEYIEYRFFPLSRVIQSIGENKIKNSTSIVAAMWLDRNKENFR